MSEFALREMDDHWILPLESKVVLRCFVDHAFGVELGTRDVEATFRIECPFSMIQSGRQIELSLDDKNSLGIALTIVGRTLRLAKAAKNGRLELHFSGDCMLQVNPQPRYEAWGFSTASGLQIVSTPGGELTIWG